MRARRRWQGPGEHIKAGRRGRRRSEAACVGLGTGEES